MLPPAIGPVGQTLEGHDLILVVGSSVFPYYPYIPGPLLPEGAKLVAITSDPDEAARAPMGDALVADVKLTLAGAARGRARVLPPGARAEPRPAGNPARADPLNSSTVHTALGRGLPRGRHRRARVALQHPRAAQPAAPLAPGSYYFAAGGGLGFGLAASVGVQLAQPDRPVVCVIGEGSVQYAVSAFWTAVAYKVPVTFLVLRNEEYAILKWFADVEQVAGRARARPAEARRRRGRRGLRRQGAPGQGPRRGPRRARQGARLLPAGAGRSPGRAGDVALLGDRDGAAGATTLARAAAVRACARPRPRRARRGDRRNRCAASSRSCSAPIASSPAPPTSSATPPTPAPTGSSRGRW